MRTPGAFTPDQLAELARRARHEGRLQCPVCDAVLDQRAIPPRPDVSYVRDRIWLVCPACHRSGVLDRRESGND
ncbi:MAG: hypothetical protein FJ207_02065 [Gemmatimonadetes bacterium]|nr:hypothetical protein [Gemmatimonadota bacterium]